MTTSSEDSKFLDQFMANFEEARKEVESWKPELREEAAKYAVLSYPSTAPTPKPIGQKVDT